MEPEDLHHAPLWRRATAAVIDATILGAIAFAVAAPAAGGPGAPLGTLTLASALAMFYRVLSEGTPLQATPGKWLLGLRVVPADGGPLSFATAAVRGWPWWLPGAIAAIAPAILPLAALASLAAVLAIPLASSRQGLHDRIARTYVVTRKREKGATAV